MSGPAARWGDLKPRILSAAVMLTVGALEIWLGGPSFVGLVAILTAAMIWELATITQARMQDGAFRPSGHRSALIHAAIAAGALLVAVLRDEELAVALLLLPPMLLALTPRRDRRIATAYGAGVMVAGYGLILLREGAGTPAFLWLVAVVVVSDVAGYFAGRLLGGPKFWAAISPKKTWSGTVAGWIGAAAVGLGFVLAGRAEAGLILLSPLVAFAGQMGDIAESWIKRRTGVKDSSNLIPGHGGVMDRFDALVGAMVALMLLDLLMVLPLPLPLPAGG